MEEIWNYESNKAFVNAIEAVRDSGDGFIMRSLRKLVMTANSIIGWFVDELTTDFI